LEVEFFFEEVGTAFGIAEILGDITAGFDLEGDGAALESGMEAEDALAVGVVEAFGDANEGSQAAGDALIVVIEDRIGGMVAVGLGLAVVIADDGGNDVAVAAFQTGNVTIQG